MSIKGRHGARPSRLEGLGHRDVVPVEPIDYAQRVPRARSASRRVYIVARRITRKEKRMAIEKTYSMLKPDAVAIVTWARLSPASSAPA